MWAERAIAECCVWVHLDDPETKLAVSPQLVHPPHKHNDRLRAHDPFVILIHKITAFKVRTLNPMSSLLSEYFEAFSNGTTVIQSAYNHHLDWPNHHPLLLRFKTRFSVTNPLHLRMNWCSVVTMNAALKPVVTYAVCATLLRMANRASKLWYNADGKGRGRWAYKGFKSI